MKKIIMFFMFVSIAHGAVKDTPIQRTDIGDVTVISEKVSEDKWRVTFTNHNTDKARCARVKWKLEDFYWHPICSGVKNSSVDKYKGVKQDKFWKTEKICVQGKRYTSPNTVNVIGYLKKINNVTPAARIRSISAGFCE